MQDIRGMYAVKKIGGGGTPPPDPLNPPMESRIDQCNDILK